MVVVVCTLCLAWILVLATSEENGILCPCPLLIVYLYMKFCRLTNFKRNSQWPWWARSLRFYDFSLPECTRPCLCWDLKKYTFSTYSLKWLDLRNKFASRWYGQCPLSVWRGWSRLLSETVVKQKTLDWGVLVRNNWNLIGLLKYKYQKQLKLMRKSSNESVCVRPQVLY